MLKTFSTRRWNEQFSECLQKQSVEDLENGNILFFPDLAFTLLEEEKHFLSPDIADPHAKNVSYQISRNKLWGVQHLTDQQHLSLKALLDRYATFANNLIKALMPLYSEHLTIGRTSFRPVQISNRQTSYRKDDKRLHVDAFPSAPNQGQRILRVFSNINPKAEDRVWRVGEPFEKVAERFLAKISAPFPGAAAMLRLLKITKSYRTLYDHYMLRMHDLMKSDNDYQKTVPQQEVRFPAGSTWVVQTDHVSHAAMQGQYVVEQTFYLPIKAMVNMELSPLKVLEKMLQKRLV